MRHPKKRRGNRQPRDVTDQAAEAAVYHPVPSGPSMVGSLDPDRKYAGFTGVKTSGGRARTQEPDATERTSPPPPHPTGRER